MGLKCTRATTQLFNMEVRRVLRILTSQDEGSKPAAEKEILLRDTIRRLWREILGLT